MRVPLGGGVFGANPLGHAKFDPKAGATPSTAKTAAPETARAPTSNSSKISKLCQDFNMQKLPSYFKEGGAVRLKSKQAVHTASTGIKSMASEMRSAFSGIGGNNSEKSSHANGKLSGRTEAGLRNKFQNAEGSRHQPAGFNPQHQPPPPYTKMPEPQHQPPPPYTKMPEPQHQPPPYMKMPEPQHQRQSHTQMPGQQQHPGAQPHRPATFKKEPGWWQLPKENQQGPAQGPGQTGPTPQPQQRTRHPGWWEQPKAPPQAQSHNAGHSGMPKPPGTNTPADGPQQSGPRPHAQPETKHNGSSQQPGAQGPRPSPFKKEPGWWQLPKQPGTSAPEGGPKQSGPQPQPEAKQSSSSRQPGAQHEVPPKNPESHGKPNGPQQSTPTQGTAPRPQAPLKKITLPEKRMDAEQISQSVADVKQHFTKDGKLDKEGLKKFTDDIDHHIKHGNGDSAAAFSKNYGSVCASDISNGDLRVNFSKLRTALNNDSELKS